MDVYDLHMNPLKYFIQLLVWVTAASGPGDCSSPVTISASQLVPLSLRDRFVYQQKEKLAKHDRYH